MAAKSLWAVVAVGAGVEIVAAVESVEIEPCVGAAAAAAVGGPGRFGRIGSAAVGVVEVPRVSAGLAVKIQGAVAPAFAAERRAAVATVEAAAGGRSALGVAVAAVGAVLA